MIIVCGPDNTGKTRLVEHLSQKFHIPRVEKYPTLPPTDYADWERWVTANLLNPEQCIADRFYVEEFVYGLVMRGKIGINEAQKNYLDMLFAQRDPLIILCNTSLETILSNYHEREQYPKPEKVLEIQRAFREILSTEAPFCNRDKYHFNWKLDRDYIAVDSYIRHYLEEVCDSECK